MFLRMYTPWFNVCLKTFVGPIYVRTATMFGYLPCTTNPTYVIMNQWLQQQSCDL